MTDFGFIGLGRMGKPIAEHIQGHGFSGVGFDIAPGVKDTTTINIRSSVLEVAFEADVIFLSLPKPENMIQIVRELADSGEMSGSVVVDLSTSGSRASQEASKHLQHVGASLVDAPISGGVQGAIVGSLAIMAAGHANDIRRVSPMLDCFGKVFVVGSQQGQGQVVKVLNNFLSAMAIVGTSEAMCVGVKAGIEPSLLLNVVNESSGRNSATETKFPSAVIPRTFDVGFAMELLEKDVRLFSSEATTLNVPAWLADPVIDTLQRSIHEFGSSADVSEVVKLYEAASGAEVRD